MGVGIVIVVGLVVDLVWVIGVWCSVFGVGRTPAPPVGVYGVPPSGGLEFVVRASARIRAV